MAKEAYSIVFIDAPSLINAVRAIAQVQNSINRDGWKYDPLVLIFPFSNYRLNVTVPYWSKIRGRRVSKLAGLPVRSYAPSDARIVIVLNDTIRSDEIGLISNSVHETLARVAWKRARNLNFVASNVEITIPTPYPDPIRARVRALRDYGVTVEEFDAIGVQDDRIILMEAKAVNGGRRRWENIVRRKMRAYRGAMHVLGVRNISSDFIVTSVNSLLAEKYARRAADEILSVLPFSRGRIYAAWADRNVRWREVL